MAGDATTTPSRSAVPGFALRSPDLEILENAIASLPLRVARLDARPGTVRAAGLQLDTLSLAVGAVDFFPLASFGETRPGYTTITLPLSAGDGTLNGVSLDRRRLWTYPAGVEHESAVNHRLTFAAISIAPGDLAPVGVDEALTVNEGDEVARLGRLLGRVARSIENEELTAKDLAPLEQELLVAVDDALAGAAPEEPHFTTSAHIVHACIDAASHIGPAPRLAALADALDMSDRWIRAAFHKEFGVPPSTFFRALNLDRVHRELRDARSSEITVTEVATRWGFWHLGRFSTQYRHHFGENPRETLQRPPV